MISRRKFLQTFAGGTMAVAPLGLHSLSLLASGRVMPKLDLVTGGQTQPSAATDSLPAIEALTKKFMEHAGVSAGQIAVTREGRMLMSKAFSSKPPKGYSTADRLSLFRVASCSKMFTCAAITRLHSQGKLDTEAAVFPLLGIKSPLVQKDKPDPRIDQITVQHLVDHAGGWNDHESCVATDGAHVPGTDSDPMFAAREIAIEAHSRQPLSKFDMARYMYGKKLQFTPGSQNFNTTHSKSYSNFGYLLLGLVIEKVTGKGYIDYIQTGLNPESDCSNVALSKLLTKPADPREVWYISSGWGPSQLDPRSTDMLSAAYGGNFVPELHDSAGGLMTNAETLALFSFRNAVWGLGGRAPRSTRTGSLPGTSSYTSSRANGIDAAFIFNTRDFAGGPDKLKEYTAELERHLDEV